MGEENREKEASLILTSMLTNKRDSQQQTLSLGVEATSSTCGLEVRDEDEDVNVMETDDEDSRDANLLLFATRGLDSDEEEPEQRKKAVLRKKRTMADYAAHGIDPSKLEESVDEVSTKLNISVVKYEFSYLF